MNLVLQRPGTYEGFDPQTLTSFSNKKPPPEKEINTTYFLVSLGFLLFCIFMLRYAFNNYSKAKLSNNRETTTGKLTKLQLWGKRRTDGEMVDSENISIKYQ